LPRTVASEVIPRVRVVRGRRTCCTGDAMSQRFGSFAEFYPFYLGEHRSRANRRLHFAALLAATLTLAAAAVTLTWWPVPVAPAVAKLSAPAAPREDRPMPTRGSQFAGVSVAIITPFRGGAVDYDELNRLVDWHVEQGTDGLVPCGTTGESPTLDHAENDRVIA